MRVMNNEPLPCIPITVRYALPAWSGFLSREQIGLINAFLKIIYQCGFLCEN